MMPIPLEPVRPGDLIRSQLINALIDRLQSIDVRIQALERGTVPPQGQVVITQLIPATDIRIGEELRILGREFYFSRGAARVHLNGFERSIKPEHSSDTELRIDIPSGTPLGTASVRVSNSFTSADRTINILPAQTPLAGNPSVTFLRVDPTQIRTDGTAPVGRVFMYELDATPMSRETTFTVEPVVSVAEWDRSARIVVDEHGELRINEFRLRPGQKVNFGVAVNFTPVTGAPSSFTMRLDITAEGRVWNLADRTFRHGETVLPSNPGIRLGSPNVAPTTSFNDLTNTITRTAVLNIQADFTVPDTYALVAAGLDGSTFADNHWSGAPGFTQSSVPVTREMITAGGGKHSETIEISFAPQAGARRVDIEVGYRTAGSKTVQVFTLIP
jgi:hypothetical protein